MGLGLSIVNSAKKPPRSGSTGCYAKVGGVELQPLCPMGICSKFSVRPLCRPCRVFGDKESHQRISFDKLINRLELFAMELR